ncbi:ATP phosphoribosyltransferase regulatory subunit [Sulfurovum sp. XGS-02]|uniref:ATP phosphoribosyltransferase regulatory subunit n=1 Tax=Sulfurovum sp. XGS-02 TaxID=2925411 RepID=UPI00205A4C24|nr:ATP phosphoribosyltransferase regulatory subunit [Sulfurovum sp. XGS-02]UPT77711.1 ATP phosphoribosyltransferase regulatory subunit [Sulfurovum sp. XGS-02]
MIFEHEIPSGSRLYFGQSAKVKREIESIASETLERLGFEEIVTPLFSYHQHECFEDQKLLVRLNDAENHEVTLRADSTADVVRIVTKRLGRSTESKKWFYIQPTVTFPTKEQYQIGAEVIDGSFEQIAETTTTLLKQIGAEPVMQIANIRIPHLLNEKYGVSLEVLKSMHVEQIMAADLPWIEQLVRINAVSDLEDLSPFPEDIKAELGKIKEATDKVAYSNMVISPLFYAKMRYYDSLTFRMFEGNSLLAMGGIYTIDGVEAAGFALYTDECISNKMNRG